MRFGGWWALGVALWAAAAVAQPAIKDPTPDDPKDPGWQLGVEEVLPGGPTLSLPGGMVFLGTKETEDFLILEKHTGHIRHFTSRVEQPLALDLAVDTCGDRGLIGIALHPDFERGGAHVADPDHPEKDWVYVSYHDNAANPDDCGPTAAVFHVVRYTWNGTTLTDPVSIYSKALGAGEITAVGGVITTTVEFQLSAPVMVVPRLYILMGSLGRNGKLQNNKLGADLDDTSVMLRLNDDGTTPKDNPFDNSAVTTPETKDRYFAYGFRDPRGVATDPVSQTVWFTEYSDDGKPDEINVMFGASNGGYSPYQGKIAQPKKNTDLSYELFDLAQTNDVPPKPVSTFLQPRFSFDEGGALRPNGIAFGGVEVGPQHREDAFVGTVDGNIYRFPVESFRGGFQLTGDLVDQVANLVTPNVRPPDPPRTDDLTQIWIGERFGRISELETGSDGSIYSVDQDTGKIYRIFFDATRGLVVTSAKVPTKISVSAKKPVVSKLIRVNIVNTGDVNERIDSHQELNAFLGVEITPIGPSNCAPPAFDAVDPKYVSPPYGYPIGIKAGGGKLAIDVNVQWTCDNGVLDPNPVAGVPDFDTSIHLDPQAIGIPAPVSVCPRPAVGSDPGCGPKGGGPFVTDIIEK